MTITTVRARTEYGEVEGRAEDGVEVFRGIPFAAPPFDANRFKPPMAPTAWSEVRDASVSGPAAPQPVFEVPDEGIANHYFNPSVQGEDCLSVDVWTPDATASGLPVMVWIHGGGYMFGVGSAPASKGLAFARDGIVHVSLNYRLGVDGFTYFGDPETDNLGLRDQVFGLEWVKRNVASFGGDPANVTIFGESGGAVSVVMLMSMPSADGLFARAIIQSGSSYGAVSAKVATKATRRLARKLKVAPTREGFASIPLDKTLAASVPFAIDFINPLKHGRESLMISPFRAVYGTPTLPRPELAAAADKAGVPVIAGTNRNEAAGFLKGFGNWDHLNPLVARFFLWATNTNRAIRAAYTKGARKLPSNLAVVEAAWTDFAFRIPTIRLLEARTKAPSWLYEFHWETPTFPKGLGSLHSLEIPFMSDDFETLRSFGRSSTEVIEGAPEGLAQRMHAAWVSFAKTGDPGWPAYELTNRTTKIFDTEDALVDDAASPEREAWIGRR